MSIQGLNISLNTQFGDLWTLAIHNGPGKHADLPSEWRDCQVNIASRYHGTCFLLADNMVMRNKCAIAHDVGMKYFTPSLMWR